MFSRGIHRKVDLTKTSKNKRTWEQERVGFKISNFEHTDFSNVLEYSLSIPNV